MQLPYHHGLYACVMGSVSKDSVVTIVALGLIAYASADVAHHVFGHGGACLALRGRVDSLSSVHVQCSVTGSAVDLAGPIANLMVGVGAWLGARIAGPRLVAIHLCFTLVAAFNLFWFGMQLVFSAATKTDDWAWAMQQYHVGEPLRYAMIACGVAVYVLAVRIVAHRLAPFGQSRARIIAVTAWVTAGTLAILTALLDPHGSSVVLRDAVPQSLLLPIGLLFAPARAARTPPSEGVSTYLEFSMPWIFTAGLVAGLSIAFLGPGVAIAGSASTPPVTSASISSTAVATPFSSVMAAPSALARSRTTSRSANSIILASERRSHLPRRGFGGATPAEASLPAQNG